MTATTDHLATVRAALAVNPSHLMAPSIAAVCGELERLRTDVVDLRGRLFINPQGAAQVLRQTVDARDAEIARLTAELAAARAVPPDVEAAIVEAVEGAEEAGRCSALGHAYLITKAPFWTVPRLKAAIARAISDATAGAVAYFIDGHAKRLCEQAGEHWTGDGEQLDAWAAKVHDVLNHLHVDADGTVIDGRASQSATVGGLLATAPRCSCTGEAGDSRCDAHPSCSECGDRTARNVDDCADHCQACASLRRGDAISITSAAAMCTACKTRGPIGEVPDVR